MRETRARSSFSLFILKRQPPHAIVFSPVEQIALPTLPDDSFSGITLHSLISRRLAPGNRETRPFRSFALFFKRRYPSLRYITVDR